ncbi:MAG: gluconate 2-dehydrogenase subunit 3 family protein [Campylobacterales bacterium]|nr:gluconate 2-dehydrogenase subunit 3 family protein [Campylobacterales bacterium]
MKRRRFLILGSMIGIASCLKAETIVKDKAFESVRETIDAVLAHFFPEGGLLPSAKKMRLSGFVQKTMAHPSFDQEIRAFVIDGAKELERRTDGTFCSYDEKMREKALRAYEATNYGRSWLSRVMTLGMEGLLSDPIYGSNQDGAAWKALETSGGLPRPRKRYIDEDL